MKPNLKRDFHELLTAAMSVMDTLPPYDEHAGNGSHQIESFRDLLNTLFWRYTTLAGAPLDELSDREFAKHLRNVRITEETERDQLTFVTNL